MLSRAEYKKVKAPYDCDADRASEESDLSFSPEIQALVQGPVRIARLKA